jgi:hypothetical protein
MKNEILKTLTITDKNSVLELNINNFNAPFMVHGGAVFKNGIKLGFCNDDAPCNGSLCSNDEKLLFFTNNTWNNICINGLTEYHKINMMHETYVLNLNLYNMYYFTNIKLPSYEIRLMPNKQINESYMQNVDMVFNNINNDKSTIVFESCFSIYYNNVLDNNIMIESNIICTLHLQIMDNIIIIHKKL